LNNYDELIRKVFPQARHHACLFHADQTAVRHIKDYLRAGGDTHTAKSVMDELVGVLHADTRELADVRYSQLLKRLEAFADTPLVQITRSLEVHYERIMAPLSKPGTPRTNNPAEHVIRMLQQQVRGTYGYTSVYSVARTLKLFQVYYRFRPFIEGRRRGRSPLELAGYDLKGMDWLDYVLG